MAAKKRSKKTKQPTVKQLVKQLEKKSDDLQSLLYHLEDSCTFDHDLANSLEFNIREWPRGLKQGGVSNPELIAAMRDLLRKGKAHDKKVEKRVAALEKDLEKLQAQMQKMEG